eukprot:TRINITY_DN20718_c0_g1_i4.p1 TRINITY_DN20718_c0_g1~~TRINITY_DN20718_c0_g1_i4.p1  ORF type:complete len:505 (+),score=78.88 TRINITY_DN20718_c0_g1_i4:117-1631(+)
MELVQLNDKEKTPGQSDMSLSEDKNLLDNNTSGDQSGTNSYEKNGSLQSNYTMESSNIKRGVFGSIKQFTKKEPLLVLTVLGVIMGVVIGIPLRQAAPSDTVIRILGLPGEIMINLLKMLVLPLISTSMILGVYSLQSSPSSSNTANVAKYTLMCYAINMLTAVVIGLVVVLIVRPGRNQPFSGADSASSGCHDKHSDDIDKHTQQAQGAINSLLNTLLNFFPANIVTAAVNMNVLGIISFSLMFGVALSSVPNSDIFMAGLKVFSDAISKMVQWVIWMSPFGIFSLILESILEACSVSGTLEALGLFILTVLLGLLIFMVFVLPLFYWGFTRKNPLKLAKALGQALVTGFGTDSSAATLPVIMECAEKFGLDKSIIDFVLPLGTTINMSGTALYEAIAVLFIAQANGVQLSLGQLIVVALTATLAAMGAAAIPSAGLVTMIMVLTAVGMQEYTSDIAVIFAVDWFLDRCRTVVNLLGDGTCCAVVDYLIKRNRQQEMELHHIT